MAKNNRTNRNSVNTVAVAKSLLPFKVVFNDNSVDLIPDGMDPEKARPAVFYGFGEVRATLNAITSMAQGRYPVTEQGFCYLKMSFEEAKQTLQVERMGYVIGGERLAELISSGVITHGKPVIEGSLYRVAWNGVRFTLSEVPFVVKAFADMTEWEKHDLNAHLLIDAYRRIGAMLAQTKQYIRLVTRRSDTGEATVREEFVQEKKDAYAFIEKGDLKGLNEFLAPRVERAVANSTERKFEQNPERAERVSVKADAFAHKADPKKDEYTVRVFGTETDLPLSSLLGYTVQYMRANGTEILGERPVSATNIAVVKATIISNRYQVRFIGESPVK